MLRPGPSDLEDPIAVAPGGKGTIKWGLDKKHAGCGLTSAIFGAILAASGLDVVHHVSLRGRDSGHSIIAVQTQRGLLFADGQQNMVLPYPDYLKKRQREAERWGFRSATVFDRSLAGDVRGLLILWTPGKEAVVTEDRAPYFLCSRNGQ
jgi:hypothetical protein